ncbi:hypothetical protein Q3G72_022720 [Acer saccharum]|nr:hypothetical protein Q3G72_022720 [Acer saccharum]
MVCSFSWGFVGRLPPHPFSCSPVYNQPHSSSQATSEESIDHDVLAVSLDVSSVNIAEVPESIDVCVDASTVDGNNVALISNSDPLATSLSSLPCPDDTQTSPTRQLDDKSTKKGGLEDDSSVQGVLAQAISLGMIHTISGMEKLTHGQIKLSSFEVQTALHSPGLTPPLYATAAAAYMQSGNSLP